MILSYLNILFKYMSYFPILRDKNAKNGNEFYDKFLDSITTFGNTYFGTKIFRKDIVLVKDKPRRSLSSKEIETFVKIYLLPKLYLFYSKIDYTFTSNIKGYYEYYYDSYNRFNILCKYYLNSENPVVRKINFDIYQKVKKDAKNKGNNTLEMLKKIKENNVKNADILKILKTVLEKKISDIDKKNKGLKKIQTNFEKMKDKITRFDNIFNNNNNINTNTKKPLFERINIMYDNLYSKDINEKHYPLFLSKISNCERIYYEILQIYSETIVIIRKYKFDINLDLNTLYDNATNYGNYNMKEQNKIQNLIDRNNEMNILYSTYKESINNIIEIIDKENNNIDKYLLSNKNKNKDTIIGKLIISKKNIKINPLNVEKLNTSNSKNYFYKLLFNIFTYIDYSNLCEIVFLQKISKITSFENVPEYNTIISTLSSIKDIEFEYNKILKKHENYLNESIKDADEEKANLEEEKKTIEEENIEDVESQIIKIKSKIEKNKDELKKSKDKIKKLKEDIARLEEKITTRQISEKYTVTNKQENNDKLVKQKEDLVEEEKNLKSLEEDKISLTEELDELTDNKLKNSIIIKKKKMNIEVIKKLIALYENIHKVCDEVKQDDILKPLTTEFESANEYSSNIIKFIKELKKENENTNENNIVSCFKQNHLTLLLKSIEEINNGKNADLLKSIEEINNGKNDDLLKSLLTSPVFFNKSKIKTKEIEEENPYFNIDFIEAIRQYIGNDTFIDFLKNENKSFKSIIIKLLKENRNNKKFQYIINTVKSKFENNISNLNIIIKKCRVDEEKYKKSNKKNTEIYPYTNFIISYFAVYLMIINLILQKL
jgi:hypothetical protein